MFAVLKSLISVVTGQQIASDQRIEIPPAAVERTKYVTRFSGDEESVARAIGAAAIHRFGEGSTSDVQSDGTGGYSVQVSVWQSGAEIFTCELKPDFQEDDIRIASFRTAIDGDVVWAAKKLVRNLVRQASREQFRTIRVLAQGNQSQFWGMVGFKPTDFWFFANSKAINDAINYQLMRGAPYSDNLVAKIRDRDCDAFRRLCVEYTPHPPRRWYHAYLDPKFFTSLPPWDGELIVGDIEGVEILYETDLEALEAAKRQR